jgi:septal ring factor EnvC (AmiA/AmiB activator)
MNPLPWIQLAVTLLTPLIVLAVAWGRLSERDRETEKTTEKILKAIEGVDAKLETIKEKLATHDTRISTLDTRLASLDSEFRRLETLVSVIQADVRAQGLDIQRNSILAPAPITRKTKA